MAGIGTRIGIRAARWLLDAVMMRRLPRWQRCVLAVLLVLLFVVPPVVVGVAVAVWCLRAGKPGWLIASAALVGVTVGFWGRELRRYRMRRQR